MLFLCLSIGIGFFALVFRLASALRLSIPLIYVLLVSTVFSGWYSTHELLGNGILFAMLLCVVLSWLISLIRFVKCRAF